MRIKIKDINKCKNCNKCTCSLNDIITKSDFMNLKTEQYTCPIKLFMYGLTDEQLKKGYIDFNTKKNNCVYCCLCVKLCSQTNLEIEDYSYDAKCDFSRLKENSELYPQGPSNIIAMSYLNLLFDFAAHTNHIKALSFDGAVITKSGKVCLVEVDPWNDSLECCRRLLADIILYNHTHPSTKISSGLMVLNDFPKKGSNDVFPLIEKIKAFNATSYLNIFITTFSLLRYCVLHIEKGKYEFGDLLFNASVNSKEEYLKKLLNEKLIDKTIANSIFKK